MESVWWEKITKAYLFTAEITDCIASEEDLIIGLPEYVPWYDELKEIIDLQLGNVAFQKNIKIIEDPVVNPGAYILENFCKKDVRSEYRIGKTYAEFLASKNNTVLHTYIVWVKNLDSNGLKTWLEFAKEYNKKLPKNEQGLQFVLEVRGCQDVKPFAGFQCVNFNSQITAYDIYTFCALSCADSTMSEHLRPYITELVSSVCGDDIELCELCITNGEQFAADPELFLTEVAPQEYRSDGTNFSTEHLLQNVQSKIWECQIRSLFILIEKYRKNFIEIHGKDIYKALPIENFFGDILEKPEDVELGTLYTLTQQGQIQMRTNEEMPELKMFRDVRNDLAHLGIIPYETVVKILNTKL